MWGSKKPPRPPANRQIGGEILMKRNVFILAYALSSECFISIYNLA